MCEMCTGYVTSMSGKYHNSPPRNYVPLGWDDFFSLNNECQYFNNSFNSNGTTVQYADSPRDYMTSLIGNRSLAFLRNAVQGSAPFLAYIAPHASHMPATPAPWYANAPVGGGHALRTPAFNAAGTGKHWVISDLAELSPAMVAGVDMIYENRLRSLLSVDDIIGDVVALLRDAQKLDNTYFFYTSDHG
jgi:N-acetylglucosamine-6-sulfatase